MRKEFLPSKLFKPALKLKILPGLLSLVFMDEFPLSPIQSSSLSRAPIFPYFPILDHVIHLPLFYIVKQVLSNAVVLNPKYFQTYYLLTPGITANSISYLLFTAKLIKQVYTPCLYLFTFRLPY